MGFRQESFKVSPRRNDREIIQIGMAAIVMRLDVFHIDGFLDPGQLVDLPTVVQNGWSMGNAPSVGFEVHGINLVKANERDKETNIGFRQDVVTGNVPLLLQDFIHLVKGFRQFFNGLIVRRLRFGKATSVDAIVQIGIHPFIHGVNRLAQFRWVQVQVGCGGKFIEFRIEHSNDFGTFIADNGFSFRIIKNGNRVFAVFVVDGFVHFTNGFTARKRIGCRVGIMGRKGTTSAHLIGPRCSIICIFFGSPKEPTSMFIGTRPGLLPNGMNDRHPNGIGQPLQSTVV
eukprot:scaffold7551_cov168-Amphora_coffeaeformis.AAC.6